MYMDSVRGFKDKWYVVRPVTTSALNSLFEEEEPVSDEDGEAMLGDDGNPVLGRTAKVLVRERRRTTEFIQFYEKGKQNSYVQNNPTGFQLCYRLYVFKRLITLLLS